MDRSISTRRTALVAGVFYLLTFVSIPTLFLYSPVREADYILGPGPDTRVFIGAVLEIIVALAGIGTAVALYPVVKRQNEGVALGFVAARTLEAGAIFAGVFILLAIVTLRQAGAGAAALATGQTLVGLHDWTFTLVTEPHPGRERPAAGLPALPVAPGAADPSRAGVHRRAPARHFHHGHAVRRQRVWLRDVGAPAHSRSRCGSSRWASTSSSRGSGRPVCGSSASSPSSPRARLRDRSQERAAAGGVTSVGPRAARTCVLSAA